MRCEAEFGVMQGWWGVSKVGADRSWMCCEEMCSEMGRDS